MKGSNYKKDLSEYANGLYIIRVTDYYKNFDNGKIVLQNSTACQNTLPPINLTGHYTT